MPLGLLKYGLSSEYPVEVDLPPPKELKSHYDVVIIGGGGTWTGNGLLPS